jgi:hypothetical protein
MYIVKHRSTRRHAALLHMSSPERRTNTEKVVLQVILQSGSEPLEGLNEIMAIWANEGMGVVTTTHLWRC